ncbi:hypothetical protein FDECE_8830 [Fusarium decemcellulare]|nr:hypothetical protein FDECE_8830 [Fusarium decemcellulare]
MASLLKLPQEVRDQIIRESILSSRAAPSLADLKENRVPLQNTINPHPQWARATNIFVERDQKRWLQNPLLGTNRRLRRDTQGVIQRLDSLPYTLDVAIVKSVGLMPTWLSFPVQQKHIDTLHIHFRILDGVKDVDEAFPWFDNAEWYGDGITLTTWNMMMLLSCYILNMLDDPVQNGAGTLPVDAPTCPKYGNSQFQYRATAPYTIKNIIIDITGPDADAFWKTPSADPEEVNRCKFGDDVFDRDAPWPAYRLKPEGRLEPAHHLGRELFDVFDLMSPDHPYELYGHMWEQNMGDFEVRVDGKYWDKLDGTYIFCSRHGSLFYSEEDRATLSGVDEMMQTVERRRQCGLWNESTFERLWEAWA